MHILVYFQVIRKKTSVVKEHASHAEIPLQAEFKKSDKLNSKIYSTITHLRGYVKTDMVKL